VRSSAEIPLVVLFGGGVESTTLVKQFLSEGETVWPIYACWGLRWEECELSFSRRFCEANACARLLPLAVIRHARQDVMDDHWAITGVGIPRAGDPSSSLEIPMRNLTLLIGAAARASYLPELRLVMGTTADNHFRDGTREFFDSCERLLSIELGKQVSILTPLLGMDKTQVIRHADPEGLALSFSCLHPRNGLHCGTCYKCGRRQHAFRKAGVADPTVYVNTVS
jgi:7-cyano-7-deazaguanine synthase